MSIRIAVACSGFEMGHHSQNGCRAKPDGTGPSRSLMGFPEPDVTRFRPTVGKSQTGMPKTHQPIEFTNYNVDAVPIEIPPGGVSLRNCSFRNLEITFNVFSVFWARGCRFDSCDFTGTRFGGGYFGGGEAAGFSQTLYSKCRFDRCDLDGVSFGSARFERCSFRDVWLRKWLSLSSEFIDCVFAGVIPEAAFLGRSPLRSKSRQLNDFRGNDFSEVRFGSVEFRGGIDLSLQRLPMNDGYEVLDRRNERLSLVLEEIDLWPNQVEGRSARRYLQLFVGSRYDGQEQLYIQNRPVRFIDETLRGRVVSMLIDCLPPLGTEKAT